MKQWLFIGIATLMFSSVVMAQDINVEMESAYHAPYLDEWGKEAARGGNYDCAIKLFTAYLWLNPGHPEVYVRRALAQLALDNPEAGFDDFQRALVAASDDVRLQASIYGVRAEVYVRANQVQLALIDYQRAIDTDPDYALAYRNRAVLYAIIGVPELAIEDYSTAIEIEPDHLESYLRRSQIYRQFGNFESALADLTQAITMDPEHAETYILRGHVYGEMGDATRQAVDYAAWVESIESATVDLAPLPSKRARVYEMAQGIVYRIPVEAIAGQRLSVIASSRSVDPIVILLDPDGNPIAADDDGGQGLSSYLREAPLPEDGEYTILVSHARGGWAGRIAIAIDLHGFDGV